MRRENGPFRPAGDSYRPHYSDAHRQRWVRRCRPEVETFGYRF